VAVNRIWQWHFGEGLLKSASDFGELGGAPSNQPLLDWLASEFARGGYSMKALHRLMVTSQAYQRSSEVGTEFAGNVNSDPSDAWLWHFRLQRLEAEPIWDSLYAAAGNLDLKVGGPSFDSGNASEGKGRRRGPRAPTHSGNQKRRGAYLVRGYSANRDVTPAFLQAFDVDDGRAPCPMRTQTVTAPQALFLMNSDEIESASSLLAERLEKEAKGDLKAAIALGYRVTLGRSPNSTEISNGLGYLQNDTGRLKQFSWLLFNLDEFIYVR
jgi:hypothetical protein